MVVKGAEWAALGIDNDGMRFLQRKDDKLYFVDSDIPVLQVVDSDHYIALINVYEFVP